MHLSCMRQGCSCESPLDVCVVTAEAVLRAETVTLFQLLGVNGSVLTEALTHKKIIAKGEEVRVDGHCC